MAATPLITTETIADVSWPRPPFMFVMSNPVREFRRTFPHRLREMSARQRIECFRSVFAAFSARAAPGKYLALAWEENFATMVRFVADVHAVEVLAALAVHDFKLGLDGSMGWVANDGFSDDPRYGRWVNDGFELPEWVPSNEQLDEVNARTGEFARTVMILLARRMVQLSPDGIHALTLMEWGPLNDLAQEADGQIEKIVANTDILTFEDAIDVYPDYAFTNWVAVQNVMQAAWDGQLATLRSASARMAALVLESHSLPLEVAQLIPTYIDGRDISNPYPTRQELRARRTAAASSSSSAAAASSAAPRHARRRGSSGSSDDEKPKKKESRTRGKARK